MTNTISQDRLDELHDLFWAETNEVESEWWRHYLTADEAALVDQWDSNYLKGLFNIAKEFQRLKGGASE